ncbi:hypothetical protein [Methylosinus sp. Ce-a6]|uniref:hypothetical protein n=1 Tax=Methylosinus sp. Ce-a6 TaxID=2172005 RepID=UPI001358EC67|nr:hypothetical protein [Methylosinus sp. Ce-a6]
MTIPDAFNEIANSFHQDTFLFHNSLDSAIRGSISELTPEQMRIAKDYLDELLSGKYSREQLIDIWSKSPAGSGGFGMPAPAEKFLGLIRAALETSLASRETE